jgi:outer membrane protein assembly factor BamB
MKTMQPRLLPDPSPIPEALIREARRRQRRRRLAIAAAFIALAGAASAAIGGLSGAGGGPRLARPTATPTPSAVVTRLVMASQTRMPAGSLNLAIGFGKIWVTGIGATYAVSQHTGRIVATVATPSTFPDGCGSGIATGAGAVWVTYDCRGVYRINPRTGTVTASIHVPDAGDAIAVADGLVWVTNYNGYLLRIQPKTNRIVGTAISVGYGNWAIAVGAGALWVTHFSGNPTATRIELATGSVRALPPFITDIEAVGAGSLWTSYVQRISPDTEKVIASINVAAYQVVFWRGSLWALALHRSLALLRIDPATDRISGPPIAVGRPVPSAQGTEPSSLAAGPTGLWVLDFYRHKLFHLALTS